MTNQASEDELKTKINTIIFARFYDIPDKQRSTIVKNLQALIRTEKLKLLADVRERVVGEDVPEFHDPGCYQYNGLEYCHCSAKPDKAANEFRSEQRARLTKLEAEL